MEEIENITIITPEQKQLDVTNTSDFLDTLNGYLKGQKNVVLDLKNILFMDSSGLNSIISTQRLMNQENRNLVLCNASSAVSLLFKMVKLFKIVNITPDRDSAIKSFGN